MNSRVMTALVIALLLLSVTAGAIALGGSAAGGSAASAQYKPKKCHKGSQRKHGRCVRTKHSKKPKACVDRDRAQDVKKYGHGDCETPLHPARAGASDLPL